MPPRIKLPCEARQVALLPADVVGVIATFLPQTTEQQRSLMLVSNTWYRGVIEQDGMKPKPGVFWPWCALQERQSTSVTLTVLDEPIINKLQNSLSSIELLSVDGPMREPAALQLLAEHKYFPRLKSLRLLHCGQSCTHPQLINNVVTITHLEELVLKNAEVNEEDVQRIAERLKRLTSLTLEYCPNATDATLQKLSECLPNLRELRMPFLDELTDVGLGHLAYHCPEITVLDLRGCWKLSNKALELFQSKDEKAQKAFNKLEELHLESSAFSPLLTNGSLRFLSDLTSMKKLTIAQFGEDEKEESGRQQHEMPQTGLAHLAKMKELEVLSIQLSRSLGGNDTLHQITSHFFNLTTLEMPSARVADDGFTNFGFLTQLQKLELSGCSGITDNGFALIARNCPQLTHLHLRRTKITDAGLQHIAEKLQKLSHLDLQFCRVTDTGMAFLADGLTNLESLCIGHTTISWGFDGCPDVGDEGLRHIARMPKLRSLVHFCSSHLSDAGLKHLKNLQELHLKKFSAGFTDEGIQSLVVNNQTLEVLEFANATDNCLQYMSENASLRKNLKSLTIIEEKEYVCDDDDGEMVVVPTEPTVTATGMQALISAMSELETLSVGTSTLPDGAFENIGSNMSKLRCLEVGSQRITAVTVLNEFCNLDRLYRLSLKSGLVGVDQAIKGNDILGRSQAFRKWKVEANHRDQLLKN